MTINVAAIPEKACMVVAEFPVVVGAVVGAYVSPTLVGAAVVAHWELVVGAALVGQLFVACDVLQVVVFHDCSLHVDVSHARLLHAHAHEFIASPELMSVPLPPAPLLEVTEGV